MVVTYSNNEKQIQWNDAVRKRVCASLHSSLIQICGGGVCTGNVDGPTSSEGQTPMNDKHEWRQLLREVAFSSVSFPNNGNVSLPPTQNIDVTADMANQVGSTKVDGKPHDIEIRAALKLFHRFKTKKRKRDGSTVQRFDGRNISLSIVSDMGLVRTVSSSLELSNLICNSMEEGCNTSLYSTSKRIEEIQHCRDELDPLSLEACVDSIKGIAGIFHDIRPDRAGVICLVTKWRGELLARSGKLSCSMCVKWCRGEKGLWWHQQKEHGITHSSAATSAASQNSRLLLAIIPYDNALARRISGQISMTKENNGNDIGSKPTCIQTPSVSVSPPYNDEFDLVRKGDMIGLIEAIKGGLDPTLNFDRNGASPLMWAAGSGHVDIVRYLIEDCGCSPDEGQRGKRSFLGRTPLHWAARNGHLDTVKYLIETVPVDINASTVDGTTAFCWACWQGHLEVMRYLHIQGCDIHRLNSFGCNAALWSAQGQCSLETMKWLQSLDCSFSLINSNGHGVLHKSAQRGKTDVFKFVLGNLVSGNLALVAPDVDGCCPSDLAGMGGHLDLALWASEKEEKLAGNAYNQLRIRKTHDYTCTKNEQGGNSAVIDIPNWLEEGVKLIEYRSTDDGSHVWEKFGGIRRMAFAAVKLKRQIDAADRIRKKQTAPWNTNH